VAAKLGTWFVIRRIRWRYRSILNPRQNHGLVRGPDKRISNTDKANLGANKDNVLSWKQ